MKIGNINYAIYQFYANYSRTSSQKKEIMKFIGHYFEIFNKKISTPEGLDAWNKNLTNNKKPKINCIKLPNISPTPI